LRRRIPTSAPPAGRSRWTAARRRDQRNNHPIANLKAASGLALPVPRKVKPGLQKPAIPHLAAARTPDSDRASTRGIASQATGAAMDSHSTIAGATS
jgi:hypothetical protein